MICLMFYTTRPLGSQKGNFLGRAEQVSELVSPVDIAGLSDVWTMELAYKILDQTPCANRLIVYFSKHVYIDDTCEPFFQLMKKWLAK